MKMASGKLPICLRVETRGKSVEIRGKPVETFGTWQVSWNFLNLASQVEAFKRLNFK